MSKTGISEQLWRLLRWNDDDHALAVSIYRARSAGRLPDHTVQRLMNLIQDGVSEDQISQLHAVITDDTGDIDSIISYISLWSDSAPVLSTAQVKAVIAFVEQGRVDHLLKDETERLAASHGLIALISTVDGVIAQYRKRLVNFVVDHPEVIRFFVENSNRVLDIHVYIHELNLKVTNPDHLAELPRLLQLSSPLSPGAL